jgi:hypothetical protein
MKLQRDAPRSYSSRGLRRKVSAVLVRVCDRDIDGASPIIESGQTSVPRAESWALRDCMLRDQISWKVGRMSMVSVSEGRQAFCHRRSLERKSVARRNLYDC